jgi:hypothetical protein
MPRHSEVRPGSEIQGQHSTGSIEAPASPCGPALFGAMIAVPYHGAAKRCGDDNELADDTGIEGSQMADRPDRTTASDAPWTDVPADSDVIPGTEEPDPAEVVGDEGDERDLASPRVDESRDSYRRDTLDERLAEEEPEAVLRGEPDAEAGALVAPVDASDDATLAEDDADDDDEVDDLGAEDAAVHIIEE